MRLYNCIVLLCMLGLLISSCVTSASQEVLSATDAKNRAISFLQVHDNEKAPGLNLSWQEDEVKLTSSEETITRFSTEAWVITVIELVSKTTAYEVRVSNGRLHLHWRGIVDSYGKVTEITKEQSRLIAEGFLRKSPTFVFDGIEDSLTAYPTNTSCTVCSLPFQYQFAFEFYSTYPGYGDRSGEILSQERTKHRAVIAIDRLTVKTAIMDDTWDMLGQEMIIRPGN